MAFPQDGAPVSSTFNTLATSHAVTMPATLDAGDLILVIWNGVAPNGSGSLTTATPSGWTRLHFDQSGAGVSEMEFCVFAKVADGTEDGGTVDFVTDLSARGSALAIRVTAWLGDISGVQAQAGVTSGPTNIPFPSCTAAWGSADNLWIAAAGWGDDAETVGAFSTNYTDSATSIVGTTDAGGGVGVCFRDLAAATEQPGNWTMASPAVVGPCTIVVRPVSATVFANPLALLGVGRAG